MTMRLFFQSESFEAIELIAFLERQAPAREVFFVADAAQGALLAGRPSATILIVEGGLNDGRAEELLERLSAEPSKASFRCIVLLDRSDNEKRFTRLGLDEVRERLKPHLSDGWLRLRFSDAPKGRR